METGTDAAPLATSDAWLGLLVVAAGVLSSEEWGLPGAVAAGLAAAAVAAASTTERTSPALLAAALGTAGAGAVHLAVVAEHLREWWGFGTFFAVSGSLQLVWAALAPRRADARLLGIGLAGNAAVVALWLVTRTAGLPLGPEPGEAEALGASDVVATVLEVVAVAGCAAAVAREGRPRAWARWLLPAAAAAATAYAIAATGGGH